MKYFAVSFPYSIHLFSDITLQKRLMPFKTVFLMAFLLAYDYDQTITEKCSKTSSYKKRVLILNLKLSENLFFIEGNCREKF